MATRPWHTLQDPPPSSPGFAERDRIHSEFEAAAGGAGRFALLMVDVEGLRALNEAYGYAAGNLALKTVADAVQRTIRTSDSAARLMSRKIRPSLALDLASTVSTASGPAALMIT